MLNTNSNKRLTYGREDMVDFWRELFPVDCPPDNANVPYQ